MNIRGKYMVITGDIIEDTGLKGNELLLYSLINGFSQDGESWFYGSISYLQKWLGITKANTISLINRLIEKGFIEKKEIIENNVKRCMYRCTLPSGGGIETIPGWYRNNTGVVSKQYRGGIETIPNINNNIDSINNNNIFIGSSEPTPKKREKKKISSPPLSPEKASKKGTRLSENWQPSQEEIAYAQDKGLSQEEIATQSELFLNYWLSKSGSGAIKKDWKRTWYTWIINYTTNYKRVRNNNNYGRESQVSRAFEANMALANKICNQIDANEPFALLGEWNE